MDKRLSLFLNTLLSVALGFGVWGFTLAISNSNSKPIDLTKNRRFTLAQQSELSVRNLETPVKVYAFVASNEKAKAEELLNRYKKVSPEKFSFQVLDPRKNPRLAKQYQIRMVGEGVVEVQGDKSKSRTERLSSISEQDLTTALLKLARQKTFHAYFLTGHGEREVDKSDPEGLSQLKTDLLKEGFVVDKLNLLTSPKIPDDADLIVAAGPMKAFAPGEEKLIADYLSAYGRFLLLCEPETPKSVTDLVKSYGVEVEDKVALDINSRLIGAEPVFSVGMTYDPSHPVTKEMKTTTTFSLARALKMASPPPSGVVLSNLVGTSDEQKTAILLDLQAVLNKGEIDPSKEQPTQATLAVAASKKDPNAPKASPTPAPGEEKPKEEKEMRLVTVGDADSFCNLLYMANKDFALNAFGWLAANETQLSIRPKEANSKPLTLSSGEQSKMLFLVSFLIPGSLVGLGLFLVMRRQ